MEVLTQFAQMLGLDPVLTPVAAALGFFLVFARASVAWFNKSHTFGVAIGLGVGLVALHLTMPANAHKLGEIGWQGVALHGFVTGLVAFGGSYGLPMVFEKMGLKMLAPANKTKTEDA